MGRRVSMFTLTTVQSSSYSSAGARRLRCPASVFVITTSLTGKTASCEMCVCPYEYGRDGECGICLARDFLVVCASARTLSILYGADHSRYGVNGILVRYEFFDVATSWVWLEGWGAEVASSRARFVQACCNPVIRPRYRCGIAATSPDWQNALRWWGIDVAVLGQSDAMLKLVCHSCQLLPMQPF